MADFTRPRNDLGFMTRRVKRAAAAAPVATAPATASAPLIIPRDRGLTAQPQQATPPKGLSLSPSTVSVAPAPVEEASRLASVPVLDGKVTLTDSAPLIRLNRRSSAIGALRLTGVTSLAWETPSRDTGILGAAPPPPSYGNRFLVERDGAEVLVGLRHIRKLRRIILTGTDVTMTTFAGHTVLNPGQADTSIAVIDGVIEIRREPQSSDIAATYAIGVPA